MIPKSRYDTIDCYLASAEYNDQDVLYDKEVYQFLRDEGLDDLLAQHVAHLFIRDPICLFAEKLEQDVEKESDHFEVSTHSVNPLMLTSMITLILSFFFFFANQDWI